MPNYRSNQIRHGQIYGWFVYLIREAGSTSYGKIGSANRVDFRVSALQTGNRRRLQVVKSWHLDNREGALRLEAAVLDALAEHRVPKTEWIKFQPSAIAGVVDKKIIQLGLALRTDEAPRWERYA